MKLLRSACSTQVTQPPYAPRAHYRLACAKPPGTLLLPQLPGALLLPPPLTSCHRAAHRRPLLTPLTDAFFLPPLTGPLLLPPLTTSCSLVVVYFSKIWNTKEWRKKSTSGKDNRSKTDRGGKTSRHTGDR
ncbi:hypothetical protein E3N88_12768 [Mikania micrantha]|uniref:Uncharacterized protein n=1 Tax=Mikania micrantha TaxID=192012 RepID=A0A5N6P7S6_9ASTR|nr:hypothetical protein E3N88_12765 [Mikania micrantha]KAD5961295.1 hypothetical protein E3N88_12768 [Mikania micrantha]